MRERSIITILQSAILTGAVILSCTPLESPKIQKTQPRPNYTGLNTPSPERALAGLKIDLQNFSQFFNTCDSKEELLRISQGEGKPIFPLSFKPEDVEITVENPSQDKQTVDRITIKNPVTYISPVDATFLSESDYVKRKGTAGSAIVYYVKEDGKKTVILHSFQVSEDGKTKEKEFFLMFSQEKVKAEDFKKSGDKVKAGEKLYDLIPSTNGVQIDIYQANSQQRMPFSDLTAYATFDGRTLYCTPDKLK